MNRIHNDERTAEINGGEVLTPFEKLQQQEMAAIISIPTIELMPKRDPLLQAMIDRMQEDLKMIHALNGKGLLNDVRTGKAAQYIEFVIDELKK